MSAISNWRTSPVREFCLDVGTIDPSKTPDREFAYIDIASIDRVQKRITAPQTVLGTDAPSRARQLVKENDVLVSTVRPNLNAVAQVPSSLDGQVASTGFCVLRPNTRKIHPRLVYFWVQTPPFVEGLMTRVRGANYPAVRDVDVLESAFSTSDDIHEQARIVELLDQADALRRQRADADAKLARLTPALFRHHFGDPERNPNGYATLDFDRTFDDISAGEVKLQTKEFKKAGRVPIIDQGAEQISGYTDDISARFTGPTPVIIFGDHTRNFKFVDHDFAIGADGVRVLSAKPEFTPEFLYWHCRLLVIPSAGYSRHMKFLKAKRFIQPPKPAQETFSRLAKSALEIQTHATASAAKLETLFQTLLHRAFTGELTAKWREAHLREGVQEMSRISRP